MAELATLAKGYSGADLGGLVREASLRALKDCLWAAEEQAKKESESDEPIWVQRKHFLDALGTIKPSVSDEVSLGCVCLMACPSASNEISAAFKSNN